MTVAHSGLTGTNLHENKGVAAATDNTVATAVSGATVWAKLTASNLTGTGNSFGAQLFHAQDQKASGTSGGTPTTGAWTTHTLNTSVTNEVSGASLSSNQMILPAGTYYLEAWAVFNKTGLSRVKIYNITDASDIFFGASCQYGTTVDQYSVPTRLEGRFTLSGTKTIALQYKVAAASGGTDGLGFASSYGTEIYADMKVWKIS